MALNLNPLQVYCGDKKDIPEWLRNNHDWQNPVDVRKLEVNVYIQFLVDINLVDFKEGSAGNGAHRILMLS